MTSQRPGSNSASTSRVKIAGAAAAVVVLALGAFGLWYLFGRSGPAAVSLGTPAPSQELSSEAPLTSNAPATSVDPSTSGDPGTGSGDGDIAGTWTIDPSVGSFSDFSGTFVGYRVQEELAGIGATTAVGRTPGVTGSVTIEGTTVTAVSIEADLTTLVSDDDRRDGQLRRQALETNDFPTATFVLAEPIDLGGVPAEGATVSVTAVGDLTLHGVTNRVELPLQARLQGGVVTVIGSLEIAFADYAIDPPESMIVLSVEDRGVLELQLQLTKG